MPLTPPKRILIVDDEPIMVTMLANLLQSRGYGVLKAHNGSEALKIARRQSPDLILLDIIMPQPDGLEICRRLKADAITCKIPVIFITVLTGAKDKINGFKAGGVDYIPKPFERDEIFARIDVHLANRDLQHR